MGKQYTKSIKTPLRYPGGKSRVSDMLVSCMPYFKEYREPFVGGGSVFIETKQTFPDAKYWVNDLYYDLYCFWDEIKENKEAVLDLVRKLKDEYKDGKVLYKYLCDNLFSFNKTERAAAFFVLNRITFSGTSCSGGYSQGSFDGRFTDTSIERADDVSGLLKDIRITNLDYADVLKEDGEDVFIFMDPPYYTATKSALYGKNGELHKGFDHERFAEEVKKCNHKWMITYDDCPYIRDLYKDYNIIPFGLMYGMRNVTKDAAMKGNEILIMNYNNWDITGDEEDSELLC